MQPVGELDEPRRSRGAERPGRTSTATASRTPICPAPPSTSSPRSATTSAPRSCAPRARPTCCPTSACSSARRRPVVEMEGAERIMLGSNNYLGLTGDERVIAGRPRRAGALRHRPDRLAPAQRHDPAAPRARARDRRLDGHRGRDRLHHRPPGQRRHARTLLGAGRHGRSPTPATTPRSSTAACSRGPSCARSATTASTSSSRRSQRAAGDGGGVLVVVDGVFSMEGDIAPLPEIGELCAALRRAADGRRGPRRRRARRPRRRARPSCSASRTASTCGWARSPSRWPRAAASSPGRPRSSSSCASSRAPFLFTASARARRRRRRAGRAARSALGRRARALLARVLDNARYLRDGLQRARLRTSSAPHAAGPTRDRPSSPRSSRCWSATTGRPALLWRALYDAGVFVNTALHPAVPPGGALLRTSVMATHDRATLDRALEAFATVKARLRGRARAASGPG